LNDIDLIFMSETRKLAAIMFTDIVGYSALMSKDEKKALSVLEKNRKIHKVSIEKFNGEFIKEIGDGTLSVFKTSSDAVNCALAIQEMCCDDQDIKIRFGIHMGEIVVIGNDVFGDGVNIASRIEAAGESDRIYISGRVYEDIKNKADISAEYVGEKRLKNIDYLVKIYVLGRGSPESSPPAVSRSRKASGLKKRKIHFYLVIASLFALLTLLTLYALNRIQQKSTHGFNKDLIAVAIFENQTGDELLDPVGRMASDWITKGIAHTEILSIVPSYAFESGENIHQNREGIRTLAEKIGAKTIVTGVYYMQGNQLQFHTHIVDAEKEKVLSVLDPVSGPIEDPMMAIERLKQKVMGSLISIFDPYYSVFAEDLNPPSYEAYKEIMIGMEYCLKYNWEKATPHFYKAEEIDTTCTAALIMALQSHSNYCRSSNKISECEKADSLYHIIVKMIHRLTKRERTTLNFMYAELHGNNETYYKNVKEIASANYNTRYELGWAALITNRLEECIEVLKPLNPEYNTLEGWYWRMYTSAYHLLGRAKLELKAAKQSRKQEPNKMNALYLVARAYISNNKTDKIDALIEECYNLPESSYWNPASFMYYIARELRIHGYLKKSREICREALTWCKGDDENHDYWMAQLYYLLDDWDESQILFEQLFIINPNDVYYPGYLGMIAAQKSDKEKKAEYVRLIEEISSKYLNGEAYMWRARIATVSGDKDVAIKLIRKAISDGFFYYRIHNIVEFETLYDHPPFQDLMKPK